MNTEEYEKIVDKLQRSENLIIYGLGEAGDNFERICKKYKLPVVAYADSYRRGMFYNHPIYSLEELAEAYGNVKSDVVICAGLAFDEIKKKIEAVLPVSEVYDGGDVFLAFLLEETDTKTFYDFYKENEIIITDILGKLADEFSREVFASYLSFLQSKDSSALDGYWSCDLYFPKDFYKERSGVFIDGGAYNGKSAKDIITHNPMAEKVICYEPFEQCIPIIKENIMKWGVEDKVEIHNTALYSVSEKKLRLTESGTGSKISSEGVEIVTEKIDDLELENISFIKLDIEGAELEALKGAADTIKRNSPYLAICIYHKPEDIVEIPNYIMSLGVDYSYYIRHHEGTQTDLVFYAVPN